MPQKLYRRLFRPLLISNWSAIFTIAAHIAGWRFPTWLVISAGAMWLWQFIRTLALCISLVGLGRDLSLRARGTGTHSTSAVLDDLGKGGILRSITPYDLVDLAGRDGSGKPFDIFLSYKSEDAAVAREIAEQLLASGLTVWFAEYVVLLTGRDRFEEAVLRGVRRSHYGLLLTNDRYIGSPYCRFELDHLIDASNCGPAGVIEVKNPAESLTHEKRPALADCPATEWTGDVNDVLRFIRSATSLPIRPAGISEADVELRQTFRNVGSAPAFSLNVGRWEAEYSPIGLSFGCHLAEVELDGNLQVGRAPSLRPRSSAETADDRESYDWVLGFARTFMESTRSECAGVHILPLAGFSHVGLSYWGWSQWWRRYSVMLPDPRGGDTLEFAFLFRFPGTFVQYCRYARVVESLVSSLRWEYPR